MSEISVAQAADLMGVSPVRVRQLAASGAISARKVGNQWLVEPRSVRRVAPVTRPMARRTAWGLLELSAGRSPGWLDAHDRHRLRKQLSRLADDPQSARLAASWLSRRAERLELRTAEPLPLDDHRLVPSGVSDPRAKISAPGFFEGYVHVDELDEVMADHELVEAGSRPGNVVLHVTPLVPEPPLPLLATVVDLVEHGPGREYAVAQQLMGEVFPP
ncbi:helix-turn-helix domain-containing protein [Isoptericola sp. G70]|uniref:helix-turn-helix domain-containing protein n=1 Tax=Isoptericola sp. G70 TaxID=3376633 RepID=UPI003A8066C0